MRVPENLTRDYRKLCTVLAAGVAKRMFSSNSLKKEVD
jgi:hypothetical protein